MVKLRVGEVDGNACGAGFATAMLFGDDRFLQILQEGIGGIVNVLVTRDFSGECSKVPHINIAGGHIGAKNGGVALRVAACLGNGALVYTLQAKSKVV